MELICTEQFKENVGFYVKEKKYTKILEDLSPIADKIMGDDLPGSKLDSLALKGIDVYKAATGNSSANRGKSDGLRVIYYVVNSEKKAYLLTLYSKKDTGSIPGESEILYWIESIVK